MVEQVVYRHQHSSLLFVDKGSHLEPVQVASLLAKRNFGVSDSTSI